MTRLTVPILIALLCVALGACSLLPDIGGGGPGVTPDPKGQGGGIIQSLSETSSVWSSLAWLGVLMVPAGVVTIFLFSRPKTGAGLAASGIGLIVLCQVMEAVSPWLVGFGMVVMAGLMVGLAVWIFKKRLWRPTNWMQELRSLGLFKRTGKRSSPPSEGSAGDAAAPSAGGE